MKKRIVGIVLVLCLVCSLSATACAETITLGTVWFKSDGSAMDNDFQKNLTDNNVESELKNRMRELQPGDDVTFVINLRNEYSKSTNWYMTSKIVDSLEEGSAKNGAYEYYLRYVNNTDSSKSQDIFNSLTVGGDNSTGLMEINEALKEDYTRAADGEKYFYLDNLARGQGGQIILTVALDGETQGNDYQDRLADLKMNFAVQVQDQPTLNAPKTSDMYDLFPYYVAMVVSGLLFLYFALDAYTDRLYKKGKGRG